MKKIVLLIGVTGLLIASGGAVWRGYVHADNLEHRQPVG